MEREEESHDEDHAAPHGEGYEEVERRLLEPCEADGTLRLRCLGVAAWGTRGCSLYRMGMQPPSRAADGSTHYGST